MIKGKTKLLWIATILWISFYNNLAYAQSTELTGRDVMIKVDNRPDGNDRTMTMNMTLINKQGKTRERSVVSYSKGYDKDGKSLICFKKPADVKGTGFLSWEYDDPDKEDDRWLYLPALKKVRRISGSSKNDYFMGTDFTYDDLGDRSVDEDNHELLREEDIDENICWVVESKPKNKDDMYSKVIRWIRQDALMSVKVEFYDKQDNLLKILTISDIRKHDEFWTAFKMEMQNIQEKHKTILEITEMHYNQGLKDNFFKVSTLESGKIR